MDRKSARQGYTEVMACLADIGFLLSNIEDIKQILAVILHLGNVSFMPHEISEHAVIDRVEPLIIAADLLGVSPVDLGHGLQTTVR